MRVIIVCQTLVLADAIGHDVIEEFKCLKEEGIEVYLYAEGFSQETENLISKDSINLLCDKDTVLIYHHSIFWDKGIELLKAARCKKIIKYHNVTPEHFFLPYSFELFKSCLFARRLNRELLGLNFDMLLSDSTFNAKDFIDIGFPEDRCRVLAPFHKIHEFGDTKADIGTLDKLNNGKINIFFCGRVAPNKGHKHILYTAYYCKLMFDENIRFVLAGTIDENLSKYWEELNKLSNTLGLSDVVEFVGKVSFNELKSYYLGSHAFLVLSEHEGFCVPVLEAQYFRLPIIAYDSSAVKETMGENQLVYDTLNYDVIASSIHTLYNDASARQYLAEEGYKNFLKYERANLKDKFMSCLREIL